MGGTLVQPGEEVSANALMEPYTEENGYGMAASFENGEVVDSMGGGICQVSTTLYNALLLAEVEITETVCPFHAGILCGAVYGRCHRG